LSHKKREMRVEHGIKNKEIENERASACVLLHTECFIDLGKLNLLKISLPWSKSVKLTEEFYITGSPRYPSRLVPVDIECILKTT